MYGHSPPRQATYRIHFEINQLPPTKRNHDLSLIDSALQDRLLSGGFPFIDTFVRPDMTYPIRINLFCKTKQTRHVLVGYHCYVIEQKVVDKVRSFTSTKQKAFEDRNVPVDLHFVRNYWNFAEGQLI